MSGVTGIGAAVAGATVPKAIRDEGAAAVQGFRAALSFESMLLKQILSEALPESPAGTSGEEDQSGEGGSALTAMPTAVSLPETVAEAVVGAGGLGLATEMYPSFVGVGK
ncbi:MAG TPA: hypothetical protein VJL81_17300 [Solirubrobacterales bacterium]|nr:hypothetical protein [Solirubrobacterales bacterium]